MKKNMSTIDRVIRVIIAVLFFFLYFSGQVTGALGVILLVVGIVFLATSTMSFCPIYRIFNTGTLSQKKTQ